MEWMPPKTMEPSLEVNTYSTREVHSFTNLSSTSLTEDNIEEVSEGELEESKQPTSSYRCIVGLKEREQIAKAAFKTWFRIKPGNKEIKDRWWALYYRKILPKYQLRDNHLGRQINTWIEEELRSESNNPESNSYSTSLPMQHPVMPTNELESPDQILRKKRKPNSSKEGTIPAYLNVELIHPTSDLIRLSKLGTDYNDGTPEYYAQKLTQHCVEGRIDFDLNALESEIAWFRENRNQIMENIPSLSKKTNTTVKQKKGIKEEFQNNFQAGESFLRADIIQTEHGVIVKADMPSQIPQQDFHLQCNGNHLLIKGERKVDTSGFTVIQGNRPSGKIELYLTLPPFTDTSTSEQTFCNGVLTVKFPIVNKNSEWKTLTVAHLKDDNQWMETH